MRTLRWLPALLALCLLLSGCEQPAVEFYENAKEQLSADTQLTVTEANRWDANDGLHIQYDVTVTNVTEHTLETWGFVLPFSGEVFSHWNCTYTLVDGTLTLSPAEYNAALEPRDSASFGLIISEDLTEALARGALQHLLLTEPDEASPSPQPSAPAPSNPAVQPVPPTATATGDWLTASGNRIYNASGEQVWITGLNWFGYNTGTNTFDGLWSVNLDSTVKEIAKRGFNLIRVPFSVELINQWAAGTYPPANINGSENPHLTGKTSLEIWDYFLSLCDSVGLKVMVDIHSAQTDAMGHMTALWYTDSVTEADYLAALKWMAARYQKNDVIVAFDLKNEPHGGAGDSQRAIWNDSDDQQNWRRAATAAALTVLGENPNVLVVVEGIEIYPKDVVKNGSFASRNAGDYHHSWWGGNLRGVADYPIDLGAYQNKLVYSPHDYGPAVYQQPWFQGGFTYQSLYEDCWRDNWMFIHEAGTAPLLIGEWGGFMSGDNLTWMTHLRQLITDNQLHHTFWCLNPNSGDTGGLLQNDWRTWDEEKYAFVQPALWGGGLSAETPLGG